MYLKDYLMKRKKQSNFIYNFTPVTAVSVHAQANGRKYHGDLAIMKSPMHMKWQISKQISMLSCYQFQIPFEKKNKKY